MVSGGNRFLSIGAAAGSLALLAAVVLMLWPPDPGDYAFTPGRDRPDGETVGWVSKVESNTIHVNSGPFGGGVVPLVVTKTTRITVGTKDGWFEDIRPGGQVKVAYELYHGRRFARSVELLVDEGARRSARPSRAAQGPRGGARAGRAGDERTRARDAPGAGRARPRRPGSPRRRPCRWRPRRRSSSPRPRRPGRLLSRPPPLPPGPHPRRRSARRRGPSPRRQASAGRDRSPAPARVDPAPTRNVSAPENGSRAPEPARAVEAVRPPAPAAPRPVEPARARPRARPPTAPPRWTGCSSAGKNSAEALSA